MGDYQIGKVIAVSGESIIISLLGYDQSVEAEMGVPESMTVHLPNAAGPIPVLIGQPGTFVTIALPTGRLLCMVISVEMREAKETASELREADSVGAFVIDRAMRSLVTIAVGTLDATGRFERGSDVLPTVNAPVFAVPPELIDMVYSSYAEGDFAIGKLSLVPSQQAKINLDAFLTRHAAILGQTGGGKSWTVASLIQRMCRFQQATIVLFDLHGEYTTTFGTSADVITATDLELPYWLMNLKNCSVSWLTVANLPLRIKSRSLRNYYKRQKRIIQKIKPLA